MAVEMRTKILAKLTGLGKELEAIANFVATATCTRAVYNYQVQAVADTDEILQLGDVTTPELVVIHCVSNDVDVDTSYSAAFSAEIEIQEGEWAVFKPTGTVRIKNDDAAEQSTIEAWIIGT